MDKSFLLDTVRHISSYSQSINVGRVISDPAFMVIGQVLKVNNKKIYSLRVARKIWASSFISPKSFVIMAHPYQ